MAAEKDPHKKKIDAISLKIILFAAQETYTDEIEAQAELMNAVKALDKAKDLLISEV